MNCQTFSQNPRKWGKSHHHPPPPVFSSSGCWQALSLYLVQFDQTFPVIFLLEKILFIFSLVYLLYLVCGQRADPLPAACIWGTALHSRSQGLPGRLCSRGLSQWGSRQSYVDAHETGQCRWVKCPFAGKMDELILRKIASELKNLPCPVVSSIKVTACMNAHRHACTHACIHAHTHTYTRTHTHTQFPR